MERHRNLAVRGSSDASGAAGPSARKRTSDVGSEQPSSRRRTHEASPDVDDGSDMDEYDPTQSMQERREIQRKYRDLQRELKDNPDAFVTSDGTSLLAAINGSDNIMRHVKQPAEAAIDARGLVTIADLSARRLQKLTAGNTGDGVDVDEFVSKCITFMQHGGGIADDEAPELSSTQRRRRRTTRGALGSDDDEDGGIGDDGDMFNWAHLGRYACVPAVRRPALPGFLLGPLSIEKKTRKITKRNAPLRVNNLREIRPEELRAEDLKKSDKNDLPSICKKIHVLLEHAQQEAQDAAEDALEDVSDPETARAVMDRYALRTTGGIDLLRFVINPHSFGQTVENMFYVSFLIREGSVTLEFDENGLPSIQPVRASPSAEPSRSKAAMRHQAIMSIDMETWRDLIDAFDIKEPMIPTREEEVNRGPGARGWYS
ncbi:hypothetical protein VTJ83DRAFT_1746 [Remersonia thermophila]|uniref:Non-structural maintenance of chromosomes element 4 n=1 Tax=Remersonia thermophila TaxID=72144 RepID=A0ABR4DH25_9PEZI